MTEAAISPSTDPWVRILSALEKKITRNLYDTWLKPTRFSHATDKKLFVIVPGHEYGYIEQQFGDLICEALDRFAPEFEGVKFITSSDSKAAFTNSCRFEPQQDKKVLDQLNPNYTFETFVIGSGNRFAHAAASAVAERPAKAYSPFFLYGDVGMGKTHLLHAIAHEVKRRQPQAIICYLTGDKFISEMMSASRYDFLNILRSRLCSVDLLLIDDVQLLSQKGRAQQEFFHIFNALHQSMKQIVISSDRPPKELPEFEVPLRSRFEWGLIADIQPLDIDTRTAILRQKAGLNQVFLTQDLAFYIASNVHASVRQLEGTLVSLTAYCSLTGVEANLSTVQEVLKKVVGIRPHKVTIEAVQRIVAEQFGLKWAEMRVSSKSRSIVFPRQIAMYLAKQMTGASLSNIGFQFGGKHHSTVAHSTVRIEKQRARDKELNGLLNRLTNTLSNSVASCASHGN